MPRNVTKISSSHATAFSEGAENNQPKRPHTANVVEFIPRDLRVSIYRRFLLGQTPYAISKQDRLTQQHVCEVVRTTFRNELQQRENRIRSLTHAMRRVA